MTFKKWYTQYRHDNIEGEPDSYTEQWIRDAWDAATRAERERCLTILRGATWTDTMSDIVQAIREGERE